jgi:hypothetical protein
MTNDALASAIAARDAARESINRQKNAIADATARIAKDEIEIAKIDEWIDGWYRFTGATPPRGVVHTEPVSDPTETRKRPKNPDRRFVAEFSAELIREHGVPITRRELFDRLAEAGIEIKGKDPEMVLSTMLWREPEVIVRLPNYGYWPKAVPYLPAQYDPALEDLLGTAANEPEGGEEADDAED